KGNSQIERRETSHLRRLETELCGAGCVRLDEPRIRSVPGEDTHRQRGMAEELLPGNPGGGRIQIRHGHAVCGPETRPARTKKGEANYSVPGSEARAAQKAGLSGCSGFGPMRRKSLDPDRQAPMSGFC